MLSIPTASAFDEQSPIFHATSSYLSTYSHRAFSVAEPAVWNSLPDDIRDPECSAGTFRPSLKTFLFSHRLNISVSTALVIFFAVICYIKIYIWLPFCQKIIVIFSYIKIVLLTYKLYNFCCKGLLCIPVPVIFNVLRTMQTSVLDILLGLRAADLFENLFSVPHTWYDAHLCGVS